MSLTVLCGLPASGKSTWAATKRGGPTVLTADAFRCGADPDQTFKQLYVDLRANFAAGHDVVLDTCALHKSARLGYLTVAEQFGARTRLVFFCVSWELCSARNEARPFAQRATVDWQAQCSLALRALRDIRSEPWDDIVYVPKRSVAAFVYSLV
jgi:predicted kinase